MSMPEVEFQPLSSTEREDLRQGLLANSQGKVLLMNSTDTAFAGVADEVPDEEVINAIKQVPTHY